MAPRRSARIKKASVGAASMSTSSSTKSTTGTSTGKRTATKSGPSSTNAAANVAKKKKTSKKSAIDKDMNIDSIESIFDIDNITSKVASFCNYKTKVKKLRSLSKRVKNVVSQELYNDIANSIPLSVQSFSAHDRNKPTLTITKVYHGNNNDDDDDDDDDYDGDWSSEYYNSREAFFEKIWDDASNEGEYAIDDMYKHVIGGKKALKGLIDALMDENGTVCLGDDFHLRPKSHHVDMLHEWELEFEYHGEDEDDAGVVDSSSRNSAILETFFTNSAFNQMESITPYRNYRPKYQYAENTLDHFRKVLIGILVHAKSVAYHKLIFHTFGWPDGYHSMRYEHCGDDLDFGDMHFEVALAVAMPDGSKIEVVLSHWSHKNMFF